MPRVLSNTRSSGAYAGRPVKPTCRHRPARAVAGHGPTQHAMKRGCRQCSVVVRSGIAYGQLTEIRASFVPNGAVES
jgi:hypothetical protein